MAKKQTVAICRVSLLAQADLEKNPLSSDQTLSGSELRFPIQDLEASASLILSRSGIEVLQPWSLRERIRQKAEETSRLHSPQSPYHCYSPDGRFRLEVSIQTQSSESGPVSYTVQDLTFRVFDPTYSLVLQHQSTRASNDGDAPSQSGVQSWGFRADSRTIQWTFVDGTVQELPLPHKGTLPSTVAKRKPKPIQVQPQQSQDEPLGDNDFWNPVNTKGPSP